MNIHQLSLRETRARLASRGLRIPCGPFTVSIRSHLSHLASIVHTLYGDFPLVDDTHFVDFEVAIDAPNALRRFVRRQVGLSCDGRVPFKPLPRAQAYPMLEWGLNWVISSHAHAYLIIHAAAVEKEGRALILAADPGSGKSTLCAALVHQGWRLLSDELALVELASGRVLPIARPISLKNASIDIVRKFGGVVLSPECHDTAKGSIAHMKPPAESVAALGVAAVPALVVFPKFVPAWPLASEPVGPAHTFLELARHAFNMPVLAGDGFDAIARIVETVQAHRVAYASLGEALPEIDRLWRDVA